VAVDLCGRGRVSRTIYVNGRYLPYPAACVHPEDRGFQFGDAVYEVIEVRDGGLVDEARHTGRLERSLAEIGMRPAMTRAALARVLRETVRRNRVRDGIAYLQVSRGAAPRNFLAPPAGTPPTVVCLARTVSRAAVDARAQQGIAIKTFPETRWARCDIKTVMLLPASLAKEAAAAAGAQEAWFVDAEGFITEGASSNAWIIDAAGALRTRACDSAILRGVTRSTLVDLLRREGLDFIERAFTVEEAKRAREAFITSATNSVMPVVRIDDAPVGIGSPGPVAKRLRALFHSAAEIGKA
jgi:D-alanine transaminase